MTAAALERPRPRQVAEGAGLKGRGMEEWVME